MFQMEARIVKKPRFRRGSGLSSHSAKNPFQTEQLTLSLLALLGPALDQISNRG